jgi:hypothetical protein
MFRQNEDASIRSLRTAREFSYPAFKVLSTMFKGLQVVIQGEEELS